MSESKVFSWTCSKCGVTIRSLYPAQLEQNKEAHLRKHEKREEEDETVSWM